MRPAIEWARLIHEGEFAFDEAFVRLVQRDCLEYAARLAEEAAGARQAAESIRATKGLVS